MLSDAEYSAYCEAMGNSPAWGGQVELRVLSSLLKAPIHVRANNLSFISGVSSLRNVYFRVFLELYHLPWPNKFALHYVIINLTFL
jgi:hypothetical protein